MKHTKSGSWTRMHKKLFFYSLAISLGVVSALYAIRVMAFDPDAPDYGHSYITQSIAGAGYASAGSTLVPAFTATMVVTGSEIKFAEEAVEQLVLGVRSMDFLSVQFEGAGVDGVYFDDLVVGGIRLNGLPDDAEAHCDEEQILGCSNKVFEHTKGPDKGTGSPSARYDNESAVTLLKHAANLLAGQPTPADEKQAFAYAVAARLRVGRALHITQDFYAHSNWSDLKAENEYLNFFGNTFNEGSVNRIVAEAGDQTCLPNPVSQTTVDQIKQRERGNLGALQEFLGLNIIPTPYADLAADSGNKPFNLGTAFFALVNTFNDVKKYILNWGNSGGNWQLSTQKITSGYFFAPQHATLGLGTASDASGRSKCDHGFGKAGKLDGALFGVPITLKVTPPSQLAGINKDAPWTPFTTAGPSGTSILDAQGLPTGKYSVITPSSAHKKASLQAALATRKIFQNVIDGIEVASGYTSNPGSDSAKKLRDQMVELFMGVRPVVAIVVDTTGSMQDIMDGLTTQVQTIAAQENLPVFGSTTGGVATAPISPNKKFMLVTYSESVSNVATVTVHRFPSLNPGQPSSSTNAEGIVAKLRDISASGGIRGGGDCKEPTMKAVLQAIQRTPRKSKIFVFTDASTKDANIKGSDGQQRLESAEITRLATAKQLEISFSLSGSCSPISPAYYSIAAASGGQALLVDHTSTDTGVALANVAPGTKPLSTIHTERSSVVAGSSKGIAIPVEGTVQQLLLTITNDNAAGIAVRDPRGNLQTLTPFVGGAMLKVTNPASGNWSIGISGWPTTPPGAPPSSYSVKAQALGVFDLNNVDYSTKDDQGRSGHVVHMPYGITPPATEVRISAQLSTNAANNPASYQWQAIAEDGSVLGSLNLSRKTPDQYEGTANLTSISTGATQPWRIRVSGIDTSGQPFARMLPALQSATRLTANITQLPSHWVPGATHSIKVRVDNYGSADGVSLAPSVSLGQLVGTSPAAEVAAADYAVIEIKIAIPANTAANSTGLLSIPLNSRNAGNTTVQMLNIPYTVLQDTDGDGVPDVVEMGSNGIDANYDGNGDGTPDWKQASVISLPSDQRRAYLTATLSAGQFRLARTAPAEGLAQLRYTIDLIDFKIAGLSPGASTQMKIQLPGYMTASGYGKFGPVPGNSTPAWYDFNYDAATGLGAAIDKNIITLNLKDGAKGDDDLSANGEIVDIGGPIGVQIAGAGAAIGSAGTGNTSGTGTTPDATPGATGGSGTSATGANPLAGSSGGGGGCTVGDPTNPHPDASLWLLLLAALAVLGLRAVPCVSASGARRN